MIDVSRSGASEQAFQVNAPKPVVLLSLDRGVQRQLPISWARTDSSAIAREVCLAALEAGSQRFLQQKIKPGSCKAAGLRLLGPRKHFRAQPVALGSGAAGAPTHGSNCLEPSDGECRSIGGFRKTGRLMPQPCQTNDFRFHVPNEWVDRTMVAWSAPPAPGNQVAPNILVAYDKPRTGETLASYVDRQLKDLSSKARRFGLDLKRDVSLAGQPAVELVFHWDNNGTFLKQRQIYALVPGGRVISIVNTARQQDFDTAEPQFLQMLNSFSWNAGTAMA